MPYLAVIIYFIVIMTSHKRYHVPIIKLHQPDDSYKKRLVQPVIENYPYHLNAEKFTELGADKFSFQMVGDTGGVKYPDGQQKIAQQLCKQISESEANEKPAFLYHLGDVVYHFGEAEHYERQFFKPYEQYYRPIFAIAGNHDSDINPVNPIPYHSLDAFKAVFCDAESRPISFANTQRKSMVQPNIYWTLQTPLATIIGLHSNVPKYGFIDEEQRAWFIEELKMAAAKRPDKIIIVTIHHAPYSADVNHGSSIAMISFLEDAFERSGVRPDIIFSGHVHNYQRFNKTYPDGKLLPFVVCGAGGFDELHYIVEVGDSYYSDQHPLLKNVTLEKYCEMKHGFLKITLERKQAGISLSGEYTVLCNDAGKSTDVKDVFEYTF